MVTYIVNKRPIVEKIAVRCKEELTNIHTAYLDFDYESIERYPRGTELFKVVESVGSSGGKRIRYFEYLHDILRYLRNWVDKTSRNPIYSGIAVILTELKDGKHKKVIVNRNSTWRVD